MSKKNKNMQQITPRGHGKSLFKNRLVMRAHPSMFCNVVNWANLVGVEIKGIPEIDYFAERIRKGETPPRGCERKDRVARMKIARAANPVRKVHVDVRFTEIE